ncbi:hypothetical protein MPTA5024_06650 [Microbispora sp. ATCC PTA-5024]|nr:hypothetical protein MPTA5024_06650 [Microbispora sp. ATCC PTA-5024]
MNGDGEAAMPRGERPEGLLGLLAEDLRTVVERDPSVRSRREALLHPVLPALWLHRAAHLLHRRGRRLPARLLMVLARAITGVEIHPGAVLGRRVFVDHGAAVVIGETAVVGDDVTVYHQVTLGALGWWRDNLRPEGDRRHPVIGSRVVLGVGATVLGPVHVGDDAVVGARALVLADVPAGAHVCAPTATVSPRRPRPPVPSPDERRGSMDPDSTVLIVGATDETVRKAKELGLRVLLLQHPTKVTAEQEELADVLRVLDYTDWAAVEPVARSLREEPGFRVALSITEPGLENAGRINDLFGLDGTGYAVTRRLRDKLAMRRHLAGLDPSAVAAAPLARREDLDVFAAAHGYPFIVKPTDATASIGVLRVGGPDDAQHAWETVERLRGTRTDRVSTMYLLQDFLMEEYVEGPEFSVEAFSFAGRHVVVAITEKFGHHDSFAELGHAVPARLDEPEQERIRASVGRFLDQIGLRDGVSHTEVRLAARGPVIIESHNRIAGDLIPELVRGAYGVDLTEYALGWPFRLVAELPDRPEAYAGACVRSLVSEPGRVESVEGGPDAAARDGVLDVRITAKPGDTVHAVRDNWDRLGLVAVIGPDTTAAIRRGAEVIEEAVRIRVAGEDGRTWFAHAAEAGSPAGARA